MPQDRLQVVDIALQAVAKLSFDALIIAVSAYDNDERFAPDADEFEDAAEELRKACMTFVALEHPVASDLKFPMAALRSGQDYERIFELSTSLWKRISGDGHGSEKGIRLIHGDAAHAVLTAATAAKSFHAVICQCRLNMTSENWQFIEKAGSEYMMLTKTLVENAQEKIKQTMNDPAVTAEAKVEIVLAARHIKRIVSLMFDIIEEFRAIKHE